MKLPSFFSKGRKRNQKELFLSLVCYPDAMEAAVWELGQRGRAVIIGAVTQDLVHDSWDERLTAADKCITTLEGIAQSEALKKVILGLPAQYLTPEGDIEKSVRPHIKQIAQSLGLEPLGFVSVYQALVHKYKKDEGIPPSLILVGCTAKNLTVTHYRVGVHKGQQTLLIEGSVSDTIERALAAFPNEDILPSRILLYGTQQELLEEYKRELLRHSWNGGVHFIHVPKVEVVSGDGVAIAVSYAGAAELTQTIDEPEEEPPTEELTVAPATHIEDTLSQEEEQEEEKNAAEEILPEEKIDEDEEEEETEEIEEKNTEEREKETDDEEEFETEKEEEETETFPAESTTVEYPQMREHANVVPVTPEQLGFTEETKEEEASAEGLPRSRRVRGVRGKGLPGAALTGFFSRLRLPHLMKKPQELSDREPGSHHELHEISTPQGSRSRILLVAIPFFLLAAGILYLLAFVTPSAKVTVHIDPKVINLTEDITIGSAGEATSGGAMISGAKQEKSVSEDKTVPATGKKTVGDPARGSVTIFNKTLSERTFKKGTVFSNGSLDFSLDNDVSVASASESLAEGTITYGKATGNVTAKDIGSKGNIPAGREFTLAGFVSSIASARNEQAFSGGSSKDITVVSRQDQDNLVKAVTQELTDKAKKDLQQGAGEETLIDGTIKSTVTEKVFSQEIGQETQNLKGTVTITVSGLAYKAGDIRDYMKTQAVSQVPQGYELDETIPQVTTTDPVVQKDGKVTLEATVAVKAYPTMNVEEMKKEVAGKSIVDARADLGKLPGVNSVEIVVNRVFNKQSLPSRTGKITLTISKQ